MNGTRWERFMRWLCRKLGHRGRIDYDSPGGGDPEVCTRCRVLLSTAYSRSRQAKDTP